jgi:hypothetical protein
MNERVGYMELSATGCSSPDSSFLLDWLAGPDAQLLSFSAGESWMRSQASIQRPLATDAAEAIDAVADLQKSHRP